MIAFRAVAIYCRAMDRQTHPSPPARSGGGADTRPSIATPFVWLGGSLLLTATTFTVSLIALVRAFGALF